MTLIPPSTAQDMLLPQPSSTGNTGAFGNHLFELRNRPRFVWPVRVSLIDARVDEQRRESRRGKVEGGLLFDFFLLAVQEKEVCCRATPDGLFYC